jgi:hypothetical protein
MSADAGSVQHALGVVAHLEQERGHWVVSLDVTFWNGDPDVGTEPLRTVRKRINTYPSRQRAELAASLMVRAAARDSPHLPPTRSITGP